MEGSIPPLFIYKELKHFCIHVSRKWQGKTKTLTVNNKIPPVSLYIYPNQIALMFPTSFKSFHLQFQGFDATSHSSIHVLLNAKQSNLFQFLSHYQQRHKAISKEYNTEKTTNNAEITVAIASKMSVLDKHACIVSLFLKTEKIFRISCSIRLSDKIIDFK